MENFMPGRNTFAMFVQIEMSDYRTSSYSADRNEAGISGYPAVPCMVCYGILYDRIERNYQGFESPLA